MPAPSSSGGAPIEVEQKYRLRDVGELERQLARLGATEGPLERHRDTYYRHPSRDFAQTREALRIRRVLTLQPAEQGSEAGDNEEATTRVTYKGPYTPAGVKSRPELEWRIDPCDPDGQNLAQLLNYLGLSEVLTVHKTRRSFHLERDNKPVTITIDEAHGIGMFAEIETIAADPADGAASAALVTAVAEQLGLREVEQRSYLRMALEQTELGSST
jgi:adenylate cyclase class 2